MKFVWPVLLSVLAFLPLSARAATPSPTPAPIGVFRTVDPGIYRGARPDAKGLAFLAQLGVKYDLDLEDNDEAIAAEKETAESLGIQFISMPMSGFWTPDDKEVEQILSILEDAATRPIFIHCQHGQDRTGLIVALYRVFNDKWTPKAAHKEMIQDGFHPILFLLNHYYEEKTGFED